MAADPAHSSRAYLALGSNLGNRLAFLRGGRDALLNHPAIELLSASPVYETRAVGGPADTPPFLNAVLAIATSLTPEELLETCQEVEDEFGRTRPERWAPRTLDVDILLFDDRVVSEPELEIPHPRYHQRAFVLRPLLDLAPELVCPRTGRTIAEIAGADPEVSRLFPLRPSW